jgi:uncharacterized membrane protein
MRPPLHKTFIPLMGLHTGSLLIAALIHVWFADLVAVVLDMSVQAAYGALMTLLMMITVVRTVLILLGKDPLVKYIESRLKRDENE